MQDSHPSNNSEQNGAERRIVVQNGDNQYTVIRPIARTAISHYHLCQDQTGEWRILCIAATVADNPTVDWTADILRKLAEKSDEFEKDYHATNLAKVTVRNFQRDLLHIMRQQAARESGDQADYFTEATPEELESINRQREELLNRRLHYDWLFPMLSESFICEPQGRRQVNILSFSGIDAQEFMPLSQILDKGQRVDLKTSAWIIGRMLKLLVFITESEIHAPLRMDKFLLAPNGHHLVMLDWSNAIDTHFNINREGVNHNIMKIGQCGLDLIGATSDQAGWQYNYPCEEKERDYIAFLHEMATLSRTFYRSREDALKVHHQFYDVVDEVWGKAYHPFTTFPR